VAVQLADVEEKLPLYIEGSAIGGQIKFGQEMEELMSIDEANLNLEVLCYCCFTLAYPVGTRHSALGVKGLSDFGRHWTK